MTRPDKIEKDVAKRKKEIERLRKEAADRKKEQDKIEKEAEKKLYALEKSRIAMEKLQLNWIKWNITCIALGFTAYKFYYSRIENEKNPAKYHVTGRELGIFLIILGFATLFFATLQHRKSVEKLKAELETMHYSLALRLSYVVMGFSLLLLLIVISRS